jgi:UDP:flavonoid glycosyltransferase YjiC (YdhE family)
VRVLFGFAGGSGHFNPLVPIATAVADAGHTVAFAPSPSLVDRVRRAGFTAIPAGPAYGRTEPGPLVAPDIEAEERGVREYFAGSLARHRAADLAPICAEWKPDVIVCDEMDFGPLLAGEQAGIPCARVLVLATGTLSRPDLVDPALDRLGLKTRDHLVISPFPPSFRDPAVPVPPNTHTIRWTDPAAGGPADPGLTALTVAPSIYVTLGTIFNLEAGDLFARLLAGLGSLGANLLMTVGPYVDPATFGPQPPHVRIAQYVPQTLVIPGCDLVVSHGGSGSVFGALRHGKPMMLAPMGADQPHNAERVRALGAGEVLDVLTATPGEIAATARAVRESFTHRRSAQRLRDEIAALPAPASAVPLLEALA